MDEENVSAAAEGTAEVAGAQAEVTTQDTTQAAAPVGGGKTLATRDDDDDDGQAQEVAKGDGETEDKPAPSPVPESPDGYELTFAEGVSVDEVLLGDFKETAHSLGISQDQAAKLASFYADYVTKTGEQAQAAQAKALHDAVVTWESEIKASPTFREDKRFVTGALAEFGGAELTEILDQTLIGSHPAMFKFLQRVGVALAESKLKGLPGAGKKDRAEIMYPNQNS